MQFSPDGQWFWDGVQWRAAYSPDRRWRWDGGRWVPAPPQRWRYQPTAWTRRLQIIVLLLTTLGILEALVSAPTVMLPAMQQSMDRAVLAQPAEPGVDPAQLQATIQTMLYAALGFAAAFGAAFVIVTVIGTLKLWRWVYWLLAIGYLFALLGSFRTSTICSDWVRSRCRGRGSWSMSCSPWPRARWVSG